MKPRSLAVLTLLAFVATNSDLISRAQTAGSSIRQYRHKHEVEIVDEFVELLAIPNVASDTPNIRRNAAKLIEMMKRRGIDARFLEGNGPPAVFGELKTPRATTTVGIYAHYDGQPVDASKWAGDPFKPTLRDRPLEAGGREIPFPKSGESFNPEWRLYARSASDDKAPIIHAARRARCAESFEPKPDGQPQVPIRRRRGSRLDSP